MDHRMAARRMAVREGLVRSRLRWLLALIVGVFIAGVALLTARSEVLAVKTIEVNGVAHSDVEEILSAEGLAAGIPTLAVRPAHIESALAADPWVAMADVRVVWPGSIEVTILEHVPAGWIKSARGWVRVSTTGAVLERSKPPKRAAVVKGEKLDLRPGQVIQDERIVAALEFLALLPPRLANRAEVRTGGENLRATVAGHKIDLGSPDNMRRKAATLIAVIDDGVRARSTISVVAPSRPAVRNPRVQVESLGFPPTSRTPSG